MIAFEKSPLASENERLILDIVRRHEPIARALITGHTNLTQQSVHRLVEALIARGLLRTAAPLRGVRGQPSPTIELVKEAVYSVGISINTDSAILSLADFGCNIVAQEMLKMVPSDRRETLAALAGTLQDLLERHGIHRDRLVGLGFAMSGFFVLDTHVFNAPEPLRDWSLIELRPELEEIFKLPVWLENNATTGAIGESLRGVGRWCRTFAYLSFNYGFGGGLVLEGKSYVGFHGNAGEFSMIYTPDEMSRRPALQYLIAALRENGVHIGSIEELRQNFDPAWPGVEGWLADTMPMLDRLIAALIGVLDPQAIVFGGQLPQELGRMMISRVLMPSERRHRYGVAPNEARLVLSETKGDAATLEAALLPLKFVYFL
ncbi:ROK family transcriptional regulator [Rhizobium miluonense]|uniref:Sugar kinase of the NBD/HSP70 family, may contain an N-terminal HTH domain n=1 Tax=Rhizobium miluonense TaxID=411945 RepID=A0A1C3W5L1_9HYPH|nr:ROK family transcriptional regulator [Rhizobium miluonense]SCB35105.1 Sugar kinase of the NBD/HSP70 family, may contain an N-terminal HTH domain [Rhizobium miluonense]